MNIRLSLDRFEGGSAVLLDDAGTAINIPKHWLPKDAKPGDVLTLALEHNVEATRQLAEQTKHVQDELKSRDPGGDITL